MGSLQSELSLMRGTPIYLLNQKVIHPTLGEIEKIGYEKYNEYVFALCCSVKDIADILWFDSKIWYEDIGSEWDFFVGRNISFAKQEEVILKFNNTPIKSNGYVLPENTKTALNYFFDKSGEYVFIQKPVENSNETITLLYNGEYSDPFNDGKSYITVEPENFAFAEPLFCLLREYLLTINCIHNEYEFTKGGTKNAKEILLKQIYKKRKKNKKENKNLASIVSALIAKGISYSEVWNYPIYMIYNQYYRFNKINEYENTIAGLQSGAIDTEKHPINWEKIDWSSIISYR